MNRSGQFFYFLTLFFIVVGRQHVVRKEIQGYQNGQPGINDTCCPTCDFYPFATVFNRIYEYNYASMGRLLYVNEKKVAKAKKRSQRRGTINSCEGIGFRNRLYMGNLYGWGCTETQTECWKTCQNLGKCHGMTFVKDARLCLLHASRHSIGSRAFSRGLNFTITYLEKEQCTPVYNDRGKSHRRKKPGKATRGQKSRVSSNTDSKAKNNHPNRPALNAVSEKLGEIENDGNVRGPRYQRHIMWRYEKMTLKPWSGRPGVAYFGFHSFNDVLNPQDRVVALRSVPHSQPWLVNIQYGPDRKLRCGGVLLPPADPQKNESDFVITSAHCLYNSRGRKEPYDVNTYELTFGVVNYDLGAASEVRSKARALFTHPKYNKTVGGTSYDIGIIRLAYPIEFNMFVAPIALPNPGVRMPKRKFNCVVVGWDLMRKKGLQTDSKAVHHVQMRVLNNAQSRKSLEGTYDPESMICSQNLIEKEASCDGDSGGPLTCKEGKKQWVLYGIVSVGESKAKCRDSAKPLVSARVSTSVDWINSILTKGNSEEI